MFSEQVSRLLAIPMSVEQWPDRADYNYVSVMKLMYQTI
jgi:hypothetical protein